MHEIQELACTMTTQILRIDPLHDSYVPLVHGPSQFTACIIPLSAQQVSTDSMNIVAFLKRPTSPFAANIYPTLTQPMNLDLAYWYAYNLCASFQSLHSRGRSVVPTGITTSSNVSLQDGGVIFDTYSLVEPYRQLLGYSSYT